MKITHNKTMVNFVFRKVKRGPNHGRAYLSPSDTTSLSTLCSFIGKRKAQQVLMSSINKLCQEDYFEVSDTPEFVRNLKSDLFIHNMK